MFGIFLAQKLHGKPLTIVGDGNQTRDFTHVSDIVKALIAAANSDISGEVFNVGSGQIYSVNHIAGLLGGETTNIPKRPGEPDCTFADISKIKEFLKWVPSVPINIGVKELEDNISDWRMAPVWNEMTIADVTKNWFKHLGTN